MNINYNRLSEFISQQVEDFRKSGLTLDQYCTLNSECDLALLDSCLHLSQLSSTQIDQIGKVQAPPSCWFTFVQISDAGQKEFDEAIKITEMHKSDLSEAPLVVKLRRVMDDGKSDFPDPKDLRLAGLAALKFSVLDDKEAGVFKSMAAYFSKNGNLSPKQLNYLKSLIQKIKNKKVTGTNDTEKQAFQRLYEWAE